VAPAEAEVVSLEQLIREIGVARSLNAAVITAHIANGKYDQGHLTTQCLNEKGVLGPDLLWSHANAITNNEMKAVIEHGVGLACTPETEMGCGCGLPIAFKAVDSGVKGMGLGIDATSTVPADMFQQMRVLLAAQRSYETNRGTGPPMKMVRKTANVLEMATLGGAKSIGMGDFIGSITPGKRADLLITKCLSTRLSPIYDPVAALVNYANGSDIDTVFINGEIVKSGGKLVGVNWPGVRAEMQASTKAIMERSKLVPKDEVEKVAVVMVAVFATQGRLADES
jgi:cytosine/adenosine deaminase-related metal-dependent hydrolase